MTWRRWLRVLLVGAIAAEAAAFTAIGPRWRAAVPGVVRLVGYTADGRSLVAASAPATDRPHAPTVWTWDVATGRGRSAELPDPCVFDATHVVPLGAGGAVLVWEDHPFGAAPPRPLVRRVYDTATGRPTGPPIAAVPTGVFRAVTPDGAYAAALPLDGSGRIVFVALPGGEPVGEVAGTGEAEAGTAFAPAGDHAAVLRWDVQSGEQYALDVVAVQAGQVVRRIALPAARLWQLPGWHGGRAVVTAWRDVPGGGMALRTYQIDPAVALPAVAPRPAADMRFGNDDPSWSLKAGPNWVGRGTRVAPSAVAGWRDRLLAWVGVAPGAEDKWVGRVTTFHPDGTVDGQYAVQGRGDDLHVAPDGTSAACVGHGQAVELWAADTPSPWPRAIAAGLIAGVTWAWLERRRARR